jgi:hypothetical protein
VPSAFSACNFVRSGSALLDSDVLEFLHAPFGETLSEECGLIKAYRSSVCIARGSYGVARELDI